MGLKETLIGKSKEQETFQAIIYSRDRENNNNWFRKAEIPLNVEKIGLKPDKEIIHGAFGDLNGADQTFEVDLSKIARTEEGNLVCYYDASKSKPVTSWKECELEFDGYMIRSVREEETLIESIMSIFGGVGKGTKDFLTIIIIVAALAFGGYGLYILLTRMGVLGLGALVEVII